MKVVIPNINRYSVASYAGNFYRNSTTDRDQFNLSLSHFCLKQDNEACGGG